MGELILAHRNQRVLSQDALAVAANIDVRTLAKIEGGGEYQGGKLGAICKALGLTVREIQLEARDLQRSTAASAAALPQDGRSTEAIAAIATDLDLIDQRIQQAHGGVKAPNRADAQIDFSARRLVSSLAALGIPLDAILLVVGQLPDLLEQVIAPDEPFSTAHIRSAVARAISGLNAAVVQSTDSFKMRERFAPADMVVDEVKFDWASRYARRYGNPDQPIQILEQDGQFHDLDYHFLKGELIPHALKRLLGQNFVPGETRFITRSVISELAQSALEEFRRLGLYTLRYKTALFLLEDLALHPPHPWMVTPETRMGTVAYDLERARASLDYLESGVAKDPFDIGHRYGEVIHHLCSAALALYGGFLGHRETSSIHFLRMWLAIEDKNVLLWETCDLHYLTADLTAIGTPKQALDGLLKRLDMAHHTARHKPAAELAVGGRRLLEIVEKLVEARKLSLLLEDKLRTGSNLTADEFIILARQALSSHLGARKIGPILAKAGELQIGLKAWMRFDDTALAGRGPLVVVVFCLQPWDPNARRQSILDLLDQMAAHRLSRAGLILTPAQASDVFRAELAAEGAPADVILAVASVPEIAERAKDLGNSADLIDDIFERG